MNLHIKPFPELTVWELYEILRVRAAVFVVEQNCVYPDPDGTDLHSLHVWLEEDNTILAYLRLFRKDSAENTVQIGRVLTTERGKGYGAKILQAGIQAAEEQMRAAELYLEAQTYAIGFYEKAGFHVTSGEFLEDGIPHVKMTRKRTGQDTI